MNKVTPYQYQEFINMVPIDRTYDTKQVAKIIRSHAPLAVSGQRLHDVWIVCYSESAKIYASKFDLDNGPRPGLPIIVISEGNLEVAASYDDEDNERFRALLEDINKMCASRVYDEYGKILVTDFSKFPEMKRRG